MQFLSLAFVLLSLQQAVAYPTGPGACEAGIPFLSTAPHLTQPQLGNSGTALIDGGFEVMLDDMPLNSTSTTVITTGTSYTLKITSASQDTPFRGFLFRLGGASFSNLATDDANAGAVDLCENQDPPASGVGHNNNNDKLEVSATLMVEDLADLSLDVTVVVYLETEAGSGLAVGSTFHNTGFTLTAEAPPTASPSDSPTIPPSSRPSDEPSFSPSGKPSNSPSLSPSLNPSLFVEPSSEPSGGPSSSPSNALILPETSGGLAVTMSKLLTSLVLGLAVGAWTLM